MVQFIVLIRSAKNREFYLHELDKIEYMGGGKKKCIDESSTQFKEKYPGEEITRISIY